MTEDKSRRGRSRLIAHGAQRFSLSLREMFIDALPYGEDALHRPVICITDITNGYTSCHQTVPQVIEA